MLTKEDFFTKLNNLSDPNSIGRIKEACDFAIIAHANQQRESGDPYYYHLLEVANIIMDMKLDESSIITALLHDVVEDTTITLDIVEEKFGYKIRQLVDGVTKLTKIEYQPEHIRQAENFRKLFLAMSEDIRVLLVKLADRLHNMRTLHFVKSPSKRTRIAHETMEIYAPLAERIGIHALKSELQDLAFQELYPDIRHSIITRLNFLKKEGNIIIDKIVDRIEQLLNQAGLKAAVKGREKTPYSIWQKMERKNVGFEQLFDIIAFRIIVATIPECYQAVGIIHSNYHFVPNSFKDFISNSKVNGYQALHTVVIGPEHQRIEIQIRTQEMHEIAEFGVAAHWTYKQNIFNSNVQYEQQWLKELLDVLSKASNSEEFLENTKLAMYYDQVFCFTPAGHLIVLPKGATPIDFAYHIHSDVGNSCVGAKVNGRIVPLRTELQNGDVIEVLRAKVEAPSPTWEKLVITGKAKSEIRRFIRQQKSEEYLNLGKTLVKIWFTEYGLTYKETELERALSPLNRPTIEDLLMTIGEGTIKQEELMSILFPHIKKPRKKRFSLLNFTSKKRAKTSYIPLQGFKPGTLINFAECCHPLPGDDILGIREKGEKITIHTVKCKSLEEIDNKNDNWLNTSWADDSSNHKYIGQLRLILYNKIGSLATITQIISNANINIASLFTFNKSIGFLEMTLDIEVESLQQLMDLLNLLQGSPYVHLAERTGIQE